MALKPMLDESPKEPTPEETLAQERAERARAEQELRERQAAYEARLEEMDRSLRRQPSAAPPTPMTASQAKEELGLSAEDIQKDPDKALKLLEDHIRSKAVTEATRNIESQYGGLVNQLANSALEQELTNVQGRKYWQEAKKDVERYFEDNPQDLRPGRVSEVYNYFVGQNIEKYEEAKGRATSEDQAATSGMRANANAPAAEPPMRRSVGKAVDDDDKGPEPDLSEEEEIVRQAYNAYGANISKKEWVAISKGEIFPKKKAADWDAGYYKGNRRVARYE